MNSDLGGPTLPSILSEQDGIDEISKLTDRVGVASAEKLAAAGVLEGAK